MKGCHRLFDLVDKHVHFSNRLFIHPQRQSIPFQFDRQEMLPIARSFHLNALNVGDMHALASSFVEEAFKYLAVKSQNRRRSFRKFYFEDDLSPTDHFGA
jgi:hypothetical protein